jgi:hypothetical protein
MVFRHRQTLRTTSVCWPACTQPGARSKRDGYRAHAAGATVLATSSLARLGRPGLHIAGEMNTAQTLTSTVAFGISTVRWRPQLPTTRVTTIAECGNRLLL